VYRFVIGLLLLKHIYGLSDEDVSPSEVLEQPLQDDEVHPIGSASVATIDGITVTDSGLANSLLPDVPQPAAYSATGAQIQFGQTGTGLTNNGWDPFGPGAPTTDTSHHWWNIGNADGSVGFNLSGNVLNIVWGSPRFVRSATGRNHITENGPRQNHPAPSAASCLFGDGSGGFAAAIESDPIRCGGASRSQGDHPDKICSF
jgi:hypothetical protein